MDNQLRKQYCVGGQWRDSATDRWMPVTDSSTGELIAEVPCCTQDEVLEAIADADAAFASWSQTSLAKRTQMMFKWRNVLQEHLEELTYLCAKELGKNLDEARGDVLKAIEPTELACSLPFISQGSCSLQSTTGFDTSTYRMPLGVVAGIVPFNFPAMIPWGWMVPLAVATGNTVVLKAASYTPLTSMRILELFYEEAGFPAGVVNLVTCSRRESELLLTDPRVKAVTFVGSTEIGKHIYSIAAAHGKRVQAQCEAKNHALVLEDCDLESSVNAIINSTYGCAGMRCMALPVICVQESIADEFVALLKKKAMALKIGCAYDPQTNLGPVVTAAHKQSVCDWIQKGVEEGAQLMLDGLPPCSPQMPSCMSGRTARPFSTAIFISAPTPSRSSCANGLTGSTPSSTYCARNLPSASSREKPNVVCVRSFVPQLKNSAYSASWSATIAARGSSIIVPTLYSSSTPLVLMISAPMRSTSSRIRFISSREPTRGIMMSGITLTPFFVSWHAALKMARACISYISG